MASTVAVDTTHFACPVCLHVPRSSIFMCTHSHNICSDCHSGLPEPKTCPTCRQAYDTQVRRNCRNFSMEQVIESLTNIDFECKFSKWGCEVIAKKSEVSHHEKLCSFQPFPCPLSECRELLTVNNFVEHCTKDKHRVAYFGSLEDDTLYTSYRASFVKIKKAPSIFTVKKVHFMLFWEFVEVQGMSFFWVSVAGNENLAEKYSCEIMLVNDRIIPPYGYKGPVLSMDKRIDYVIRTTLGMPLSKGTVRRYRKGEPADGNKLHDEYPRLHFKITVKENAPTL